MSSGSATSCGEGYGQTKWVAEKIVERSGLDYSIIRAGLIGWNLHDYNKQDWVVKFIQTCYEIGVYPADHYCIGIVPLCPFIDAVIEGRNYASTRQSLLPILPKVSVSWRSWKSLIQPHHPIFPLVRNVSYMKADTHHCTMVPIRDFTKAASPSSQR